VGKRGTELEGKTFSFEKKNESSEGRRRAEISEALETHKI